MRPVANHRIRVEVVHLPSSRAIQSRFKIGEQYDVISIEGCHGCSLYYHYNLCQGRLLIDHPAYRDQPPECYGYGPYYVFRFISGGRISGGGHEADKEPHL